MTRIVQTYTVDVGLSCLEWGQRVMLDSAERLWYCDCISVGITWDAYIYYLEHTPDFWVDNPTIVCLCGSTRFWRTYQEAGLQETLAGKIVLSIGAASGTDDDHFGNLPREEYDAVKARLDWLHMRKIDLADEVLILNVDGYIGESTRNELAYARHQGKVIRWWELDKAVD